MDQKSMFFFHPSILQIQSLNLEDKQRVAALNRKQPEKKEESKAADGKEKK